MSALLTEEVCQHAWESIMEDVVMTAFSKHTIKRYAGTIVVVDPDCHTYGFQPLFVADVDPRAQGAKQYHEFAVAKAKAAHRTGLSGRELQNRPHFYKRPLGNPNNPLSEPGDTKYAGAVIHEGLIVAFSGVQQYYDEWIALTFAGLLVAKCHETFELVNQSGANYVADGLLV